MKRLLLSAALLLSACAPTVTQPQPQPDPGAATLTISKAGDHQVVTFSSGRLDAQAVKLTLSGLKLAVNDPSCLPVGAQLVCEIGPVGAGRMYVLPVRGVVVVQASYQRPDGKTYTLATD